jgi:hypothetical protein
VWSDYLRRRETKNGMTACSGGEIKCGVTAYGEEIKNGVAACGRETGRLP